MADPQRRGENVVAFRKRTPDAAKPAPAPEPEDERRRVRSNVAALIFAALLVVVGLYLVRVLAEKSRLEDCLLSGRNNCAPIETQRTD